MKTEPTAIDREAAQLFSPAGGMRAGCGGERNGVRPVWERLRDGSEATPDFYDTDDPATVGCMLAQVETVAGKPLDTWMSTKGPMPELPYAVESGPYVTIGRGATRGHALLAAMRGLKRAT